jgi:hypothetical protein
LKVKFACYIESQNVIASQARGVEGRTSRGPSGSVPQFPPFSKVTPPPPPPRAPKSASHPTDPKILLPSKPHGLTSSCGLKGPTRPGLHRRTCPGKFTLLFYPLLDTRDPCSSCRSSLQPDVAGMMGSFLFLPMGNGFSANCFVLFVYIPPTRQVGVTHLHCNG